MNWWWVTYGLLGLLTVTAMWREEKAKRELRRLRERVLFLLSHPPSTGTVSDLRAVLDSMRPAHLTRRQVLEALLRAEMDGGAS